MKKSNVKIEDYCNFKMRLGAAMETAATSTLTKDTIDELIASYQKCGGTLENVRSYENILSMYNIAAIKDLLMQPTLLITIDNEDKELAWVLTIFSKNNSCDKTKNLI